MMVFAWAIVIFLLFILLICLGILRFYAKEVERRETLLLEALWERRHRVPILLEESGIGEQGTGKELINIRAKLQSGAFVLEEQVALERKLSQLLKDLFQKIELESELKTDSLYLSFEKEFSLCLENIRIAENDYNFALQQWTRLCRLPWFLIFKFAFEIRKNKPLEPI